MKDKEAENNLSMSGVESSVLNSYVSPGKGQYAFADFRSMSRNDAEFQWRRVESPKPHAPRASEMIAEMEREDR